MKVDIMGDIIFEMTTIRGDRIKVPGRLDFSFAFFPKNTENGLCVKLLFDSGKMSVDRAGTLKLYGDWEYIPGKNDKDTGDEKTENMKSFFKEYKVLFAAVWERALPPDSLYDYFRGVISFRELIGELDFFEKFKEKMKQIEDIDSLTEFVSEKKLLDLWE